MNTGVQVYVTKLNIETEKGDYDLLPYFISFSITEQLNMNHLVGHVYLFDTLNIPSTYYIRGGERVNIQFNLNEIESFDIQARVVRLDISKDKSNESKVQGLDILVATDEFFNNIKYQINRPIKNLSEISSILNMLNESNFNSLDEYAFDQQPYYCYYENPYEVIKKLITYSPLSCSYRTIGGTLYLDSLVRMSERPSRELTFNPYTFEVSSDAIQRGNIDTYFDVYRFTGTDNNPSYILIDEYNYNLVPYNISYKTTVESLTFGNQGASFFVDEFTTRPNNIQDPQQTTLYPQEVLQNRIVRENSSYYNITLSLRGGADIGVGDMIDITRFMSIYNKDLTDKKLSGKWMVQRVEHNIDALSIYTRKVTLIKYNFFDN